MVGKRQPDRGTVVEASFDRSAHRARIEQRHGRIGAVVDARKHQVDLALAEQVVESDLHAVDRRAAERVNFQSLLLAHLADEEGREHRECVAHAALRPFGSDDDHPSESAGDVDKGLHAA